MAYTKHTWFHNETITKENLNHMEEGIYQNSLAVPQTVLTATLTAGQTSVSITNAAIGNATKIKLLTDTGIAPLTQSVSTTTYTATFTAQNTDVGIAIEVY